MNAHKQGNVRAKWGCALDYGGFQAIPNLLLAEQRTLRLSPLDLVVLLHVARCWWEPDRDPHPRPVRIAAQIGVHKRSVERSLKSLEEKGLIERPGPRKEPNGNVVWPINLRPLSTYLANVAKQRLGQDTKASSSKE